MDLDAIEERAAKYAKHTGTLRCCNAHDTADDVPDLVTRVRELEEENQRLRNTIADRIFAAEQECQTAITKNPTSASLNGHLVGLQRARDIVTTRQLKEEK